MRDDRDRRSAVDVLGLGEDAAELRCCTEHGEQARAHDGAADAHRLVGPGDADIGRAVGAETGERAVPLAVLEELGRRDPEGLEAQGRELGGDLEQALGLRVGKRFEQDGAQDAPHRAVGADADREREHDREGEARRAAGVAPGLAEIGGERHRALGSSY